MGYKYRGSRAGVEDWNAQLRKENQELKERLSVREELKEFLKKNDLEFNLQWDRFQWEVKIFQAWRNEAWVIVKYHEDDEKAICMALAEAKVKVSSMGTFKGLF